MIARFIGRLLALPMLPLMFLYCFFFGRKEKKINVSSLSHPVGVAQIAYDVLCKERDACGLPHIDFHNIEIFYGHHFDRVEVRFLPKSAIEETGDTWNAFMAAGDFPVSNKLQGELLANRAAKLKRQIREG